MERQAWLENAEIVLSEDGVNEMLVLAERLRAQNGGVLDDSAILAVSEATGAPAEYVRLAVRLRSESQRKGFLTSLREQFRTLETDVRRYVISGLAAAVWALLTVAEERVAQTARASGASSYGIFGMIGLIALAAGLYNVCVAKDSKVAAIAGALFGGGYYIAHAAFAAALRLSAGRIEPLLLIPYTLGGALAGLVLQKFVDRHRGQLGLKDPAKERQELLRQLVDLQEKLRSGEQSTTFLSVDIVGSTRLKEISDPLSVEFTFNEYYGFVETIARKYGGRLHSTAGDGVICAFDTPPQAFGAARNMQTGVLELNTFRNKLSAPIVLRCGIHTGRIVTPQAGDITSVNFAHVIDIAAHLQKACPPGGIAVSDATAMYLPGGPSAIGEQKVEAAGAVATVWIPGQPGATRVPSEPPPVPQGLKLT